MKRNIPSDALRDSPLTLIVPDLGEALDYFTQRLGFRVEMVVPADAPALAVIAGQGIRLRLETSQAQTVRNDSRRNSAGEAAIDTPPFIITRLNDDDWHTGRAAMQYRDLIPGRLSGRVIASHIRLPDGGEVPDYVHYHKVRFQMIYCKAGWVRVVYEDQGEPFLLEAGDCVLQPPEIRHRVLEASPGLEVIEIGCPAVHETWADHEMQLPTNHLLPDRLYGQQRFVRHRSESAEWKTENGCRVCDMGIAAATNHLASAKIVRCDSSLTERLELRRGELLFLFILKGELHLGGEILQADDCCLVKETGGTLNVQAGLELLQISLSSDC
jgi:quercetin dioxygenase-like cupin family protein